MLPKTAASSSTTMGTQLPETSQQPLGNVPRRDQEKGQGEEGTRGKKRDQGKKRAQEMGRWDKDLRSKIAPVSAQTSGELRDLPQKQSTALLPLKGSRSPRKGQRSSCSHLSPTLPPLPGVLPESRAHHSPWEKVGICPTDQMGSNVTSDPNSSCFPGPRVARGMGTNHKKN